MTVPPSAHVPSIEPAPRVLEIELLALDLATCTRCTGTLANIETAIETVRGAAAAAGIEVRLRKTLVDTEAAARRLRFVTSPTVRVSGREIVFETLESRCDSCTDLCGCAEGTSCRVWRWQGKEHTEAPVGLVVEALLRELGGTLAPISPGTELADDAALTEVPENLRRFFAGRAASAGAAEAACCGAEKRAGCCAPVEQADCCSPAAASCGCAA